MVLLAGAGFIYRSEAIKDAAARRATKHRVSSCPGKDSQRSQAA
jgi:hypothetical protein